MHLLITSATLSLPSIAKGITQLTLFFQEFLLTYFWGIGRGKWICGCPREGREAKESLQKIAERKRHSSGHGGIQARVGPDHSEGLFQPYSSCDCVFLHRTLKALIPARNTQQCKLTTLSERLKLQGKSKKHEFLCAWGCSMVQALLNQFNPSEYSFIQGQILISPGMVNYAFPCDLLADRVTKAMKCYLMWEKAQESSKRLEPGDL